MKKHFSLIIKVIAPTIFTIIIGATVLIGAILYILSTTATQLIYEMVNVNSNRVVRELNASTDRAIIISQIISSTLFDLMESELETEVIKKNIINLLQNTTSSIDTAFGVGVALEPDILGNDIPYSSAAYVTDTGRFVPYAYKINGAVHLGPGEETSANLEAVECYRVAKLTKQAFLSEPRAYEVPGTAHIVNKITFTLPLIKNDVFLGIVVYDIALDSLSDILATGANNSTADLISPLGIEAFSSKKENVLRKKSDIAPPSVIDAVNLMMQKNITTQADWSDGTKKIRSFFFPLTFSDTSKDPWVVQINIPLEQIEGPVKSSIRLALALAVFIIGSVILVLFFLIKHFTITPFIELAQLTKIMATGDYSNDISEKRLNQHDEVGEIGRAFETFITNSRSMLTAIRTLVSKLKESNNSLSGTIGLMSAHIVSITEDMGAVSNESRKQVSVITEGADAVGEIHKSIQALDMHVHNQAAAITQSSAAIEEMVGNISSIDANIGKITERYQSLTETTAAGMAKQQQVTNMMKNIVGFSNTLSETNQIISQIAEQTNLLAMNAAIEAAHAGDAGKGFAVVADEIRKLAENSSSQSKQVSTQLQQIRNGINGIVAVSADSQQAFDSIVLQVNEISNLVSEVNHAITEQNEGSKQVLDGLQQINEITGGVQNGSREMKQLSQTVLERMDSAREISAGMDEHMKKMHSDMSEINSASTAVANTTMGTTSQISSVEEAVNKFKID